MSWTTRQRALTVARDKKGNKNNYTRSMYIFEISTPSKLNKLNSTERSRHLPSCNKEKSILSFHVGLYTQCNMDRIFAQWIAINAINCTYHTRLPIIDAAYLRKIQAQAACVWN